MTRRIDPTGAETGVIHRLVDFRGKDVLEIGCGDGRVTRFFAAQARSVVAWDPDEAAITTAKKNIPDELSSKVSFRVGEIAVIDLPDGAYDVALFSGSL